MRLEFAVILFRQQLPPNSQFQQRNAFRRQAAGDADEVLAVGFGEPAVAFGAIGRKGERGAVELVDDESVSAWKLLRVLTGLVGEIDATLIDEEFLEG